MDIVFQPNRGSLFAIEVGYFDTVIEIKEKIFKRRGIPVSDQILVFNGAVLRDDLNVHDSDILDRSRIHLRLPSGGGGDEENDILRLRVKMPPPRRTEIAVEMDSKETVHRLKEKIQEAEGIPAARIVIQVKGIELCDQKTLQESEISEKTEMDVKLRPPPPPPPAPAPSRSYSGNGTTRAAKKLKIVVETTGGEKIPLSVNHTDTAVDLKKKLEKMQIDLPKNGYFFIHDQSVMDDNRSLRWNNVSQGDTIEIFGGTVTNTS